MDWRKENDIAYRKFERDIDKAVAKTLATRKSGKSATSGRTI